MMKKLVGRASVPAIKKGGQRRPPHQLTAYFFNLSEQFLMSHWLPRKL
ncbi:MAG: hypothetical protein HY790_10500 [Deltaproteobacteria bacterium]|nr:hypothetical protein [Deltaproteobacteria bacterium]